MATSIGLYDSGLLVGHFLLETLECCRDPRKIPVVDSSVRVTCVVLRERMLQSGLAGPEVIYLDLVVVFQDQPSNPNVSAWIEQHCGRNVPPHCLVSTDLHQPDIDRNLMGV
jgi:hypothetical protein